MDKRGISLQLFILLVGISVGVLFGIGVKALNFSDSNFIVSNVEQIFCKAVDNNADCGLFFVFTIIVSLFAGLLIFVGEHNRTGSWIFGMWLYVIGWTAGSGFVYIFV
ncbi:hypothetical protein HYV49_02690 [Candidatus Pacearchaeota archaeon]|nr:hypothetical protein [Candidatus Pacearchaeota archaeon]